MHSHSQTLLGLMIVAIAACAMIGCGSRDATWTVAEVAADRGHDTMVDDTGLEYHNYFLAVVLTRNAETVNLIYENQLPDGVDLAVGDAVELGGLDNATFSDTWDGYLIREVTITPVPKRE
jgi:hypothetical protein